MLTRVLARALAPEVRVCGIAPGPVAVEPEQEERRAAETALGRVGSPGGRRRGGRLPRRRALRHGHVASSSTAVASWADGSPYNPHRVEFRIPRRYVCRRGHRRERLRAHRARRRGGQRRVHRALPALRAARARHGDAPARRQRPGRGGGPGDLRGGLALGPELPPDRGSGSAWLYAVARHAIIDRARQRREPVVEVPDEALDRGRPRRAGRGRRGSPGASTRRSSSCPERERVVLELAYWSGLSQAEIASYLDVPLGTVKTRTRTGLARLAGLLEEVRP